LTGGKLKNINQLSLAHNGTPEIVPMFVINELTMLSKKCSICGNDARSIFFLSSAQVVDGYFVHFVAPENLPPMPKHVVFVLDTSGSMEGKKMLQMQSAMKTILAELREGEDFMTIVSFSDKHSTWDWNGSVVVPVNKETAEGAGKHVEALTAEGKKQGLFLFRIYFAFQTKQELNSSVTSCDKARRGGKIH
jgi:hypothetical protein